jgi:competence CoiA-like predicted nuclease
MKYTLLRKLRLDIDHLEYNLGWSIPDIYIPQRRIAIELQYSPLSEEEFLARTKRYSMNDICVLWIFHESLFDFDNGFTKAFIRAAHKLYFGRVYVFKDEDVYPLKLVSQKRVIPESFFTEGYTKTLLNKKDHHLGDPVQDYVLANKNIRYIDNDIFHLAMFYDEDLLKDVKT